MDVVFGDRDVDYLRRRHQTLSRDPLFAEMQYSEDPAQIAQWAPLAVQGRATGERIAATRHVRGTDVDFGELTRQLTNIITEHGGEALTGREVGTLSRASDGWVITGHDHAGAGFTLRTKRVFVGAGGFALRLLQHAKLPEVRGYAVLPVGAAFYRTDNPQVTSQHDGKMYGQAEIGAPPMSVPHLDKRYVDGKEYLLFGPYATFSTKLLKHGKLSDFFTTLRWHNLHVIAAAGLQNLSLVRYLIGQLAASPEKKFAQLRRFFPKADLADWELLEAGQRAQLVKPDRRRIGVLQQGTELVISADTTVSGLLGASPGASTAVPIMLDLLQRGFPEQWDAWRSVLADAIPGMTTTTWDAATVAESTARTADALHLD
ncbi:hypothetical protein AS96_07695 [Microbacterium sp. MRS-1]|nr:hypothetical protein AS96_07695 [Microbacterium sp. MRS-1]